MLLLCLVLFSCQKENTITGGHDYYQINEQLRPMLFDTGSNWIYANPQTSEKDSVVIVNIEMDTVGPYAVGNGYTASQQIFFLTYHSSLFGYYEEILVGYVISHGSLTGGFVYLSSHQIGDEAMNAKIANIHDSLIVNDLVYYKAVEMDVENDSYLKKNMNMYYVDSVGLVKKEIKKNFAIAETWILESHDVTLVKLQ
jgi:hypothetical protein